MKALLLLISLFFVTTEAFGGLPPTTLIGQTQGTKTTTFNFEVPSNLTTKTSTGTLIELADMNQLVNPSFSASTFSSSWTKTDTSGSASISAQTGYKLPTTAQSYRLNMTSWVGTVCGSILTGAPWPKQSVASMWVAVSGAHTGKVCSRTDGVIQNCVNLTSDLSDETFIEYVIPTVTTGSTAEVCYVQDVAASDVVWIGKASLGAMPSTMSPEVAQAQLAGAAYIAPTASCSLSRTNTAYGAPTTVAACPGPTIITQNVGSWQTTDADNAIFTINSLPPGRYVGVAEFQMNNSTAGAVACGRVSDGTNNGQGACTSDSATSASTGLISHVEATYTDTGNRTFTFQTRASSGQANITNTANYDGIKFSLYYYPPASKIYSQACSDPRQCENVFSAKISVSGVVTAENLEWINGNCSVASGVFTCTFASNVFTAAPNCTATVNETSTSALHWNVEFQTGQPTSTGFVAVTATTADAAGPFMVQCQKSPPDYKAQNQITGTFANVVTAPGISKPKTVYTGFGGAAATLASPVVCSTGTCIEVYDSAGVFTPPTFSATGNYQNLTIANGTCANSTFLDCKCEALDVGAGNPRGCVFQLDTGDQTWQTNSSGGAVLNLFTTSVAGVAANTYVKASCTCQAP